MSLKQLLATKSLETLQEEAKGDNRLRRVLGPVALTSLGIGAIIGAGIFVMTGEVAANRAGPAILLSFTVAGIGCALAAFCYAEFAAMAPVAGSAYTYAYATLGELFAWIIGWDLILEYAMSCATVAASWAKYLNEFLKIIGGYFGWDITIPDYLLHDPFSTPGAWFNLPAVLILLATTAVLVIGIRESATSNTILVLVKLGVVLFVIAVGVSYITPANWTGIPAQERKTPEQESLPGVAADQAQMEKALLDAARQWVAAMLEKEEAKLEQVKVTPQSESPQRNPSQTLVDHGVPIDKRTEHLTDQAMAVLMLERARASGDADWLARMQETHEKNLPKTDDDRAAVNAIIARAKIEGEKNIASKWGIIGYLGLNKHLAAIDDATRSNFMPYGFSGMMLGAAIVFFAFIGFDSISTHAEEAKLPQRDVPIGILASLFVCTFLYITVAAVITGMERYPDIDPDAAVASAFRKRAEASGSGTLRAAAGLIATGALAGMTSVLLITFLSQARIFLAMARDGLLPKNVFGNVHPRFRTPHVSTMLTGAVVSVVGALTPISKLDEMVNIGTLFAFVVVCAAVLILRIRRPEAHRPFRCPAVMLVAPLGIAVNLLLMLFLAWETWARLVIWLLIGLVIYFGFGFRHSVLGQRLRGVVPAPVDAPPLVSNEPALALEERPQ
jgi:amino acid transporter